jgi:hypothetical protein
VLGGLNAGKRRRLDRREAFLLPPGLYAAVGQIPSVVATGWKSGNSNSARQAGQRTMPTPAGEGMRFRRDTLPAT